MGLSDNGLKAIQIVIVEVGKIAVILGACVTLWIQQHNQHKDSNERLDTIAKEVKATRPLVYGEKK